MQTCSSPRLIPLHQPSQRGWGRGAIAGKRGPGTHHRGRASVRSGFVGDDDGAEACTRPGLMVQRQGHGRLRRTAGQRDPTTHGLQERHVRAEVGPLDQDRRARGYQAVGLHVDAPVVGASSLALATGVPCWRAWTVCSPCTALMTSAPRPTAHSVTPRATLRESHRLRSLGGHSEASVPGTSPTAEACVAAAAGRRRGRCSPPAETPVTSEARSAACVLKVRATGADAPGRRSALSRHGI